MANNWDSARKQFEAAIAIDPNFGPAYREWAETDYREARANMSVASARIKEAVDHYSKYLSLTDRSVESQLRYADFLVNAGDYKTLQDVAAQLSKYASNNLRVYRYLGYAAYENKDYAAGLTALNTFMTKAEPKRIIPRDYLYLGRLQVKTGKDSIGIINMDKAARLDSNNVDAYAEIAGLYYTKQKYAEAGNAYKQFIEQSHKGRLNDYFREGMSYYFAYSDQYYKTQGNKDAKKPDSTLLAHADSAFSYVQQKTSAKPVADVLLYQARVKDLEDADRAHMQALAKPFYEQYIALKSATTPTDERTKKNLSEAYAYLGAYYEFQQKDKSLAAENFEKAKDMNPESKEAKAYFSNKEAIATTK
jgi:tetratricopeptide (TPR) repeat protein